MKQMRTKSRKLLLLLAFLITSLGTLLAQEKQITGVVTEKATAEPIPGVSVVVKGTTNGTITDIDGNYNLTVNQGDVIVFSFIGYTSQEVTVAASSTISIELDADVVSLDEIVAVGYGVQKKKEITGAVARIKTDEMTRVVSSDFTKALQGQIAGVSVVESSGRPGEQANIQIRGLGSLNADTNPLYVVDGIPYDGNPNIASEDIESVDVLKDGAAAAVYGTRASNGVILITTKRGKEGQMKVNFSSYYGVQDITSGTELANTKEHIYIQEMMQRSQGSHTQLIDYSPNLIDYDTDFVGAITEDNATIQSYNLSLSGGKDGLTYNVNTNYFDQEGILRQSGYDRFTTRLNGSLKKGKFDAFVSMSMMQSNKENEPWGLYDYAIFQHPSRPPLGTYESTNNSILVDSNNPDHVGFLANLLSNEDNRRENSYNVTANLKYEFIKGLTYQANLGMGYWNYKRKHWQPQYLVYDKDGDVNEIGSRTQAILGTDIYSSTKYTMENILSYSKSFGNHSIGAVAAYTIEKTDREDISIEKRDFLSNSVQVYDGASELTKISGSDINRRIVGKLARIQYNFKDRYFFSASIRQDGSSVFGEENRYGAFPGASIGWNISDETFMDQFEWLDNLKLRASYGEVGNQGITPYLYDAYVEPNIDYVWGPEGSDELGSGAIQRTYGNPFVQWETNISRNIGVDLLMFNGQFSFTADLYKNDKKDMLAKIYLPASTGTTVAGDWGIYDNITSNIGNMTNKGIELSSYFKQRTKFGLNWQITGTFTKNINEIEDLGELTSLANEDSKPGVWRSAFLDVTTYMKPGYEAGSFFLIPTDGIFNTQEELDAHMYTNSETGEVTAIQPNAQLGDLKMMDTNNDGKIDDLDRVYQGSGMPDFEASLIFNADYKGFDFSTQLFYSQGNKVFNGAKLFAYSMKRHKDMYYAWTPQNNTSDIPAARASSEHENFRSRTDYFLEDGSFLRVRTLTLGYTVPKKVFNGKIDRLRVYVTGQNPFTFTNYEGYDPEIGGNGVSNRGVDKGNYPVTRKFLFGVNVDF
ncbi:SusC/RagA family TonB-linked outer membrane protein [Saccharicrinis sp. GN24d3]|uniref:SusC/RagA family TonB-linked outer membrane protein n=1 Tax=Saccharicrinis sp. GN24d3 TaxID=3458416 RepID=UPI004035EEC8